MKATPFLLLLALAAARLDAQKPSQVIRDARIRPALPSCTERGVICLADSTRVVRNECCMSAATAEWLLFPAAGDSLEIFATTAPRAEATPLVTLGIRGLRQFWQEHVPGLTAPFLRQRFVLPATYTLAIDLDMPEPRVGVPYELRIREARTKQPYAISPVRLTFRDTTARYRVTSRRTGGSRAAALVDAGAYRVIAVPGDTLLVCKLPCRKSRRIPLDGPPETITFESAAF